VVSGFDQISSVWRSRVLDTKPAAVLALQRLFKTPTATLNAWLFDDSGTSSRPHPMSNVQDAHRLYYHTHRSTHAFMTGKSLKAFGDHFQNLLMEYISKQNIGSDWVEIDDLYTFIQTALSTAAVEAMCGPVLLALNPNWIQDFWEFDNSLPRFLGGLPWLFARKGWNARQRCLDGVKAWHKYAKQHFDESSVAEDGFDPYWGSSLMRSRQAIWDKIEAIDENGRASEDLGILWG
jgi:hypothetical protein